MKIYFENSIKLIYVKDNFIKDSFVLKMIFMQDAIDLNIIL